MGIQDLLAVVPPAVKADLGPVEWDRVERELGSSVPEDYKELVSLYGPGCYSRFIHVYQPLNDLDSIDLGKQARDSLWALRYMDEEGEDMPYRLDDPAELLSFGRTDNGDVLFWHRVTLDSPDSWTVVVKEPRGEEWFQYDGGMTSFLADALSRRIDVPIFPRRFPSVEPEFVSY